MGLYEINRGRLHESKKIKEMGMRKLTTKFNPPHINKLIRIINEDIKAAFGKNGLKPEVTFDEKPNQDTCYIEFEKPLINGYGKNFIIEAENYLRGEKVDLTKIFGDPEILSAIASIAYCIDYDNATFVSSRKVALVNPEVTTYSPQLITPIKENYNKRSKRAHETSDAQYSRGYYRTAYTVAKCNEDGELITSLRDFYDPTLWEKYSSEDEIRECIEIYNASILNKGANE